MDHLTAAEVIACLPHNRTLFHYYRDRYSIGLLRRLAREPLSVAALKRTPFAALTQKPRVKAILAQIGANRLTDTALVVHDYDPDQMPFILTLGLWGSEHGRHWRRKQTSRRGYNLILQLNFCKQHDQLFQTLGTESDFFAWGGHPTSSRRNTLAWARIDLDFQTGTALIEEIQSDWIREVAGLEEGIVRKLARQPDLAQPTNLRGIQCATGTTLKYCRFVLDRYRPVWAEAMLWAALVFLRDELGISRIYYHTAESGRLLKRIGGTAPPLSLYTDLPRRFCFQRTSEPPAFIAQDQHAASIMKRRSDVQFHRMDLA